MYSVHKLTSRQTEILEFIRAFGQKEVIAPTCREIAAHFKFKSLKAVTDHLAALERKGRIRRHAGLSRGIELLNSSRVENSGTVSVPIVGHIPAGHPEQIDEQQHGTLAVDPSMLPGTARHRLFALRVRGDSMAGRGIHDGDWVVADADSVPRENSVVVALIDGENTLKTFTGKKGKIYLKAENPDYPDRVPADELVIQGVARTVLRRIA